MPGRAQAALCSCGADRGWADPERLCPLDSGLAWCQGGREAAGGGPACESGPLRREQQLMEVMAKTLALSKVGFALSLNLLFPRPYIGLFKGAGPENWRFSHEYVYRFLNVRYYSVEFVS